MLVQEITCSNEDLKELLKMDFGQFYSRILYDKQVYIPQNLAREYDVCSLYSNSKDLMLLVS